MKKFLLMLFFLGITSTGFAQIFGVVKKGIAISFEQVTDTRIEISCSSSDDTCFSLTPSALFPNKYLLLVPQLAVSMYVADPKVNGASAETLPPELPDEDGFYSIEFHPVDPEVD